MKIKRGLILGLVAVAWLLPVFGLAKTCYVNDGSSGGDGSKGDPYSSIQKAIDKDCGSIKVKKGKYKESFTLGKNTSLDGDGSNTIIEGKVKMKTGSSLEDVLIKDGGVEVLKDAKVEITDVKIEDSHIGIVTNGSGKLTLRNSTISHNDKGLYLQYGKNVDIRNNKITHNGEEGVDIRANVDGIISGNIIDSNKEGGIEVIAGKSQLTISNNSLKYNKASGIAVQFYKENSSLGNLKISNNSLIGNGNYGIDCKIPSGGRPSSNYWSQSVHFSFNKVDGNGKGGFADFCGFSGDEVLQATKTAEEIKVIKSKEEEEKMKKEADKKREEEEKERLKREEEERIQREQQKRIDLVKKDEIDQKVSDYQKTCKYSQNDLDVLSKKNKWQLFIFGPDEEMVKRGEERRNKCQESVEKLSKKVEEIKTEEVRKDLEDNVLSGLKQQQAELNQQIDEYKNKFGILKWLKRVFHYQG